MSIRVGLIGAGQMARALADGFVRKGLVEPAKIIAYDPMLASLQQFRERIGEIRVAVDNLEVVHESDVVFLAVKPQQAANVFQALRLPAGSGADWRTAPPLFISIMAGISLRQLLAGLGVDRVARVMPNTPCLVGQGASGYALGEGVSTDDGVLVEKLLKSMGLAFRVEERLLDAVTGLSGSGPAYIYLIIEALSDGGVRMGLPRDIASALAAQTVLGAAQMVLETGEPPSILKDRVASPAGTTITGLQVLEQRAVRGAIIDAVQAATERSNQLGKVSSASESQKI